MYPHEPETTPISPGEDSARNRLDRGTGIGYLGLLCVLFALGLFFLPLEQWDIPLWVQQLVPVCAVGLLLVGAALLMRVPSSMPERSFDPLRPLTGRGYVPIQERPATWANRLGVAVIFVLILCCIWGYLLVSFGKGIGTTLIGTILTSAAGCLILVYGVLAGGRWLPQPAMRWVRRPIAGTALIEVFPILACGIIAIAWALFEAASEGYIWAPLGVGLLILGSALVGPIVRRLPARGGRGFHMHDR
ncbi:MAG: hypothetical protein OJF49_000083 [Ktedonobacterales bacterium]|nr:MAG: hypothetical protein OJF49_000083 [Ktedonobacterales bacterium]